MILRYRKEFFTKPLTITLATQDCECNREVLRLFLSCGAVIFPLVTA
jgi:hypothetical protein